MSRQIITFRIGEQYLGVDIMAIREIRAWTPTTLIPHSPHYVHGVVNLRGQVLPVFDLSSRLGWDRTDPTARHVIIVVQTGEHMRGLIVDAVNDIVTIEEGSLQPAPNVGDDMATEFLEGLASVEDRMVMILSLHKLMDEQDLGEFSHAA